MEIPLVYVVELRDEPRARLTIPSVAVVDDELRHWRDAGALDREYVGA